MPVYEYTALDVAGRKSSGLVDAESPVAARQRLRNSGVYPLDIREAISRSAGTMAERIPLARFFQRVRNSELAVATRQLSILIGAGVPLVGCLEAIIKQSTNQALKRIFAQVKESINEGSSLASALSRHPRLFSPMYVSMVEAGEASGSLDLVLERLAELTEQRQALTNRLRAVLAYPVFMSCVGIVVVFFLLAFIVPNITSIFGEMQRALPPSTTALIAVSSFLKAAWWAFPVGAVVFVAALRRVKKAERGRMIWDKLKLFMPLAGSVYQKILLARFGRTLGTLLAGGVQLLPALSIVRSILENEWFQKCIDSAINEIRGGRSLSGSLAQSRWFPPIVIQMIAVGEKSGDLEQMLNRIADTYEREAESFTVAITSLLEPLMILLMGLVVGFIVISILLPIFEMSQLIR
ncbi:MAG: type II secretion system protein GspF [Desulfobacteraceae bacterium]|jgi:general secretion pathway protein F|nr:MAG: type II secretion system protein GspF [Desulfobacteraceae bacterium]